MVRRLVIALFLLLLCGVPLGQAAWELARGGRVQALDVFGPVTAEHLRAFEDDLRTSSFLHRGVTPYYQLALSRLFRRGNEKVTFGRDGWLYYAEDLDLVTAPAIALEGPGSPVDAIADFRDQLAERGAELLFVPVPAKPMVVPERLSRLTAGVDSAANPGTRAFLTALARRGVRTVDVASDLAELRAEGEEPYLARDTHWTPRAMERAAGRVALAARPILGLDLEKTVDWTATPVAVRGRGDIAAMLRLPEGVSLFDDMDLTVQEVAAPTGRRFEPDASAEILLLGDSFTRVFSDSALGFGASAGFGEHLARELGARLDVIAISGGGARAVREAVARRPGGVSGNRLVVWQVSMRDLVGDPEKWARVALPAPDSTSETPGGSQSVEVRAKIVAVSRVPEDFDYAFCLVVNRYEVLEVLSGELSPGPLWVAHVALDEFEPTPEAALQVGDELRMTLEPVDDHYDLEETSWVDDTDSGRDIWFPTALEKE